MKRIVLILIFLALGGNIFAQAGSDSLPAENTKAPCQTASLTGQNVSCYGLMDGSATVNINVAGTYRIIWSDSTIINSTTALTHTISGKAAGYYDVQVINLSNGCSAFDIVNITQPNLLTASHTWNNVKCHGEPTGSIDLTVAGGTPVYTYLWSNGSTAGDLVNIPSGIYTVTVTDSKTCQTYDTITIAQPAQAIDDTLAWKNPTCNGFTNGWIDLDVWGGTTPYTYLWNNGAPSQDLINIGSGSYAVTITDANNCSHTVATALTQPATMQLTSVSQNNLCHGYSNGTVDLTATGGTLPYTYTWANSDYLLSWSDEDLVELGSDRYYVTVTDAQGCIRIDSATITAPTQIISSITSSNVTSFGGTNGAITLVISGGVPPYGTSWSNGSSSQNLNGIPAGWYRVTITDQNGCIRNDSVYITEPLSALTADITHKNVSCFGGSDGAMSAVASGGTPPFGLLWSNNSQDNAITELMAGVYSLTVTDFYGNTYVTSDTIQQPDPITFTQIVTNVSCNGLPDGAINVTVVGGTPSYTYKWLNSDYVLAALTEDISGMPADEYYLEVNDTIGCTAGISISIQQPVILDITMSHTDVYCAGGNTGTGSCTVSGGTSPYVYAWSNGNSTAEVTGLSAGVYYITVTDNHGCFTSDSIIITQSDSIRLNFTMDPVSCIDQHDGAATVYAAGGNGDYTFSWNNGETTATIREILSGHYQVTVTDFMGCLGNGEVTVTKIEIPCINIPTCFTPNEDGLNDVWVIKDADLYPEFFMEIYNRWGQLVYELNNTYESWNGQYEGKPLPAETYYYFIRLDSQSEVLQGNVTIIR